MVCSASGASLKNRSRSKTDRLRFFRLRITRRNGSMKIQFIKGVQPCTKTILPISLSRRRVKRRSAGRRDICRCSPPSRRTSARRSLSPGCAWRSRCIWKRKPRGSAVSWKWAARKCTSRAAILSPRRTTSPRRSLRAGCTSAPSTARPPSSTRVRSTLCSKRRPTSLSTTAAISFTGCTQSIRSLSPGSSAAARRRRPASFACWRWTAPGSCAFR